MLIFVATAVAVFFVLTFAAWRRYLWAAEKVPQADTCPYSLTDVFGDRHLADRALCENRRRLHPPRHDPHHAEAAACKPLVMNPNFADGLLEKRRSRGAVRVAPLDLI
jgi:hypothetical protein